MPPSPDPRAVSAAKSAAKSGPAAAKGRKTLADVLVPLRAELESGRIAPQDRLAPERELAAQYGASRETLRRALHQLETEGLVWRHQGKGTFAGAAPIFSQRTVQRVLESASIHDLIEARLVFEPAVAAAAAHAATDDDIAHMTQLARETAAARNWRDYERIDDAFHKAVAQASGNPLLAALYVNLVSVRGRAPWQRNHDRIFRKARQLEYSAAQSAMHLAVVDAIARRDAEAARARMSDHLSVIRSLSRDLADAEKAI